MTVLDRSTHDVLNQAPPIAPYNVFEADLPLGEALEREGGAWGAERLRDTGRLAGSVEALEHSERCERNEPVLRTHDRYGNRIDEVDLDPSWHWLLREAIEREIHALPWRPAPDGTNGGAAPGTRAGGHTVRAALMYVWSQVNSGVMCPVSMTYSVIPALRANPDLAAEWEPRLTSADYEGGALAGMAMTEKQGGSDVRANITRAEPLSDGDYELTGHKWFCSYPPCDVFLTLAQAPAGLSCFLIEGADPGFCVQRLKDKLGTRSLPSSEVEFRGVRGRLVGEEGRGVPTIIRMVNHTRLDCLIGSAAGIRWGTVQAVHHARHRSAFGRTLAEQPAMQNVLADLALESEAATATAMRIARAYDEDDGAVPALRHGGVEVLDLQAGAPARRRGAGVPGWQRLRGGVGDAAAAARLPAQLDLGGLGQRGRAGRAARDGQGAGGAARPCSPRSSRRPAPTRTWTPTGGSRSRVAGLGSGEMTRSWSARATVEELGLALQGSLLVRETPRRGRRTPSAPSRLGGEGGRAFGTLPAGDRRARRS